MSKKFRTPEEIDAMYQQRAAHREQSPAYVLRYRNERQIMTFFGAQHTNDPDSPQWPVFDTAWEDFLKHGNEHKLVMYEGNHAQSATSMSAERALLHFSESGLIVWKAGQADIPVTSPEPGRREEAEMLLEQFETPEVFTYYFGRQMHQWLRQDYKKQPDWREYAEETVRLMSSLECWGTRVGLPQALAWYEQAAGKPFNAHDEATLYAISDPSQSKVSAASGDHRDELLLDAVTEKWQAGYDVFIIYGSGHAIRMEPALDELGAKKI